MLSHVLFAGLDLDGRTGLEIGALHNPLTARDEVKVLYVDHASTEELRAKYEGHEGVGELVDVDIVWGDNDLRDGVDAVLGSGALVDFVVASHVMEHVPDMVGWLGDLTAVLRPGGVIALSIPDKRYCFDARRRVSDVADVLEAHLTRRTRPPLGATFDFWTKYDNVDTAALWSGAEPPPLEPMRDREALEKTRAAAASADYHDVHCWVFTPGSLLEILRRLIDLEVFPALTVRSLTATAPGCLEFYLVLERLDDAVDHGDRKALQLASTDPATNARIAGEIAGAAVTAASTRLALSAKERRAILAKRRLLGALRRRVPRRRS